MAGNSHNRILMVTPELSFLPSGMTGGQTTPLNARAGGIADVTATLISALYHQGADIHVALPDYRSIFRNNMPPEIGREWQMITESLPEERIHLARDRAFFYLDHLYYGNSRENLKISLAFQREVINHIEPVVQPDLIHCHDWTTALVPAMARHLRIPCLFTLHSLHNIKTTLAEMENMGIDAASFWRDLYYDAFPMSYDHARAGISVDFLVSGVFAAHFVNTVSPAFLDEIIDGRHDFIPPSLRRELADKKAAGCAMGILNAPDPSYHPSTDSALARNYSAIDHVAGKAANKASLQKQLGLLEDPNAPVFFWPSRLDGRQKGCQLLADILYEVVSKYWEWNLEMVFVADGEFQPHFQRIVDFHRLRERVAVCGFHEPLARLAYGAADFVLMPSGFEPCGLPQMIGAIYGALPVAHDTGGIHDTVVHLDMGRHRGNGFLFKTYDSGGLSWAMDQAMSFHRSPPHQKEQQVQRIMRQSALTFNAQVTAQQYAILYEKLLQRPMVHLTGGGE